MHVKLTGLKSNEFNPTFNLRKKTRLNSNFNIYMFIYDVEGRRPCMFDKAIRVAGLGKRHLTCETIFKHAHVRASNYFQRFPLI